MQNCDVCNRSIAAGSGRSISADEFRRLVAAGFLPDGTSLDQLAKSLNKTREEVAERWHRELVATATNDWRLCDDCASRAEKKTQTGMIAGNHGTSHPAPGAPSQTPDVEAKADVSIHKIVAELSGEHGYQGSL